jgi:hypothetical protein
VGLPQYGQVGIGTFGMMQVAGFFGSFGALMG